MGGNAAFNEFRDILNLRLHFFVFVPGIFESQPLKRPLCLFAPILHLGQLPDDIAADVLGNNAITFAPLPIVIGSVTYSFPTHL